MAGSGSVVTFAELHRSSQQLAQLLHAQGLRPGDGIAVFLENHPRYLEIVWAALSSGLYLTTVNRYLSAEEAAYIVDDCGARALVSSRALRDAAVEVARRVPGCAAAMRQNARPRSSKLAN